MFKPATSHLASALDSEVNFYTQIPDQDLKALDEIFAAFDMTSIESDLSQSEANDPWMPDLGWVSLIA